MWSAYVAAVRLSIGAVQEGLHFGHERVEATAVNVVVGLGDSHHLDQGVRPGDRDYP